MPLDSGYDFFDGLDPVVRRMCQTLLGIEDDYSHEQIAIHDAGIAIAAHEDAIAAAKNRQEELRQNAWKLQQAALVMGYDLFKIMDQQRRKVAEPEVGPPASVVQPAITEQAAGDFSVKDFVLEYARSKHPNFVAAASIERRLRELGHVVHPKTVGMSLYRWSQRGFVRREGKSQWFYVPEEDRKNTVDDAQEVSEQVA